MNVTSQVTRSDWLKRLATTVTDVVFPPVCANCGCLGTILCDPCRLSLIPVTGNLCDHCGQMMTGETEESFALCSACTAHRPLLRQARAPLLYTEPTSELIHRMKYDGFFALANPLAAIMAENWPVWEQTPDLIVPIPLHTRRQRERGYNQSALLGKYLARQIGVAYDERSLHRHRHTQPQVRLSPDERRSNVAGAFEADAGRVSKHNIVLIDDVYTTGATMNAAADALLTSGAHTVAGYCLARVS